MWFFLNKLNLLISFQIFLSTTITYKMTKFDDLVPPGKSKSGRTWKNMGDKASKRVSVKAFHEGYQKRMEKAKEMRIAKAIEAEMKEEREKLKQVSIYNIFKSFFYFRK